ncbi:MAG: hypothetical protein V1850_00690 [Candidatus Bathyarchaeota archaeon]
MSYIVLAQSFVEKVLISPDTPFIWNFQRGVEEMLRFAKFSSNQRIQYSLELMERRIGEMELLLNESQQKFIPMVENTYELEADKIVVDMNSSDIFSLVMKSADVKDNVTQRLQYDIKALEAISTKETPIETRGYFTNAIKKTSDCIGMINSIR